MKELKEINRTFKKYNIPLWLNFGTLLGIYRDKKLIDDDIDLATYNILKTYNKNDFLNIKATLKQKGFEIEKQKLSIIASKGSFRAGIGFYNIGQIPKKPNCLYQENLPVMYLNQGLSKKFYYGFMNKNPTNFKYFILRQLGGYYITHAIPTNLICPLKKITFEKETYFIPNKTKEYLHYLYGPTWQIPDPEFPHFITYENIKKFKGTFNYYIVECPRCKHTFADTKGDQDKPIIIKKLYCNRCGKKFTKKIFLKGTIQRRIKK